MRRGRRNVEAGMGDVVAPPDQERRDAPHESHHRQQGEHLIRAGRLGKQPVAGAGGKRV